VAADPDLTPRGCQDPISLTVLKIHINNKLSDYTQKHFQNVYDINCGNSELVYDKSAPFIQTKLSASSKVSIIYERTGKNARGSRIGVRKFADTVTLAPGNAANQ
jgi:hypothetical protein